MEIEIIVAMTQKGVIGRDNQLPWHLPEDLKHFKAITMGYPIIMGRKTYLSIGKALPGRLNLVLSRDPNFNGDGIKTCAHFSAALELAKKSGAKKAFVIGGAELFRATLLLAQRVYTTFIEEDFPGDVFFPLEVLEKEFQPIEQSAFLESIKGMHYRFVTYINKKVNHHYDQ